MSVLKLQRTANRVPFSHRNGIRTILTETPFVLELFHTVLRLYRFDEPSPIQECIFQDVGLADAWTAFFDYEHRQIIVEGNSANGFFRRIVQVRPDGIYFQTQKQPLTIKTPFSVQTLPIKTPFLLVQHDAPVSILKKPFLSLGCNKDPLIDRMRDHPIMEEILPLMYHQATVKDRTLGADSLLGKLVQAVEQGERHQILGLLRRFWTMALEGNCVPKRYDNLFFGFKEPFVPDGVELVEALHIVSFVIRSLFIQEKSDGIRLLPCLPSEFPAGRLLEETLEKGHRISFEWRRGVARRILLYAACDDEIRFFTGAASCSIRCCSLKNKKRDQNLSDRIAIKSGYRYLLDNFVGVN